MSARPFHKRYHSDALAGFMSLNLEERGAYQTLLDLIYDRGGPIVDNERLLAGYMGCSPRKWRGLREDLIRKGKIYITDEGLLSNVRAEKELENDAKTSRKHAEHGSKGGRARAEAEKKGNENNERDQATPKPGSSLYQKPYTRSHTTTEESPRTAREPRQDISGDMAKVCTAAGMASPPGDMRRLAQWVEAGADIEKDILPVVERITGELRARRDRPKTFKLFEPDVLAAMADRKAENDRELAHYADIAKRYPGPSVEPAVGGYDDPAYSASAA